MIRLTRLRNAGSLYLNPDHIERLDQYHDTTVHLFNGDEFVVTESADQIVTLITEYRASILATASRLAREPQADVGLGSIADAGASGSISGVANMLEPEQRDREG